MEPDDWQPQQIYSVPRRFDLRAMLVVTTLFALLFSLLRLLNAPLPVYLFVIFLGLFTGAAQMIYGKTPRLASVVVGSILLPLVTTITRLVSEGWESTPTLVASMISLVPAGAILGYVGGLLIASVFLVMDWVENSFLKRGESPGQIGEEEYDPLAMHDESQRALWPDGPDESIEDPF